MSTVYALVPDSIDDPRRPSGGNVYDRRVCTGLTATGWAVRERALAGAWPRADGGARAAFADTLAGLPDAALVLLDGLIASAVPDLLAPHAARLRLVILVHMPLGAAHDARVTTRAHERAALGAATAIVTTSAWTRDWLVAHYGLGADRLHIARPGVEPAALAPGTRGGGALLCVAAVTRAKGHDVLLAALTALNDLCWRCVCVGTLDLDRPFVDALRRQLGDSAIADRVEFTGARTGTELAAAYAATDLLVVSSRAETYGMVVGEALARGIPVVATATGGLPEALGAARPGLLVPPGDPAALAAAVRSWLGDASLRARLRRRAAERRRCLPGWSAPADTIARVLREVPA